MNCATQIYAEFITNLQTKKRLATNFTNSHEFYTIINLNPSRECIFTNLPIYTIFSIENLIANDFDLCDAFLQYIHKERIK